jgi:hypothetical protein
MAAMNKCLARMNKSAMRKVCLAGIAVLFLATGTAQARMVCFVVTETPYGYLPLREKPAGKILEKLQSREQQ